MQYYIWFLLIYFTYIIYNIILHYIYALNNLYVSIPIFWAGLQHHVQEQLPVCKQLYIRRQQVIKLLPTVAETVLSSHKFWLIQSTLNKKKGIPILWKATAIWGSRLWYRLASKDQQEGGKEVRGNNIIINGREQTATVLNFIWRNESKPLK